MSDTKRCYALPLGGHEQKGIDVGSICWGSCGKGAVAGLDLGEYGEAIPCLHPAAECPHFAREMDEPICVVTFGDDPQEYEIVPRLISADRRQP